MFLRLDIASNVFIELPLPIVCFTLNKSTCPVNIYYWKHFFALRVSFVNNVFYMFLQKKHKYNIRRFFSLFVPSIS